MSAGILNSKRAERYLDDPKHMKDCYFCGFNIKNYDQKNVIAFGTGREREMVCGHGRWMAEQQAPAIFHRYQDKCDCGSGFKPFRRDDDVLAKTHDKDLCKWDVLKIVSIFKTFNFVCLFQHNTGLPNRHKTIG